MLLNDSRRAEMAYRLGVEAGVIVPGKQIARVTHIGSELTYEYVSLDKGKGKRNKQEGCDAK